MKIDTGRLYKGMTPQELAHVVFVNCANNDEQECEKALSHVPRKTYECSDREYSHRLDRIFSVVTLAGMYYWREFAFSAHCGHMYNVENNDTFLDDSVKHFRTSNAIREAMIRLSDKHGIDKDSIFKMTTMVMDVKETEKYDEAEAQHYFDDFERVFMSGQ